MSTASYTAAGEPQCSMAVRAELAQQVGLSQAAVDDGRQLHLLRSLYTPMSKISPTNGTIPTTLSIAWFISMRSTKRLGK